jgi:hypothetical protein
MELDGPSICGKRRSGSLKGGSASSGDDSRASKGTARSSKHTGGSKHSSGKKSRKPLSPKSKKAAARAAKPGKTVAPEKRCFICPLPKYKRSRFCRAHENDKNTLNYRAKGDGKKEELDRAMADPSTASALLDKFARENPEGKFRKNLFNWSEYEKFFTKEFSSTKRRLEEEWSWKEFKDEQKKIGNTEDEAKAKWRELLASDYEREGEGFDAKIWIPARKQRFRDETLKAGSEYTEKSKPLKNLKNKDLATVATPCYPTPRHLDRDVLLCGRLARTSFVPHSGDGWVGG